MKNKQLMHDIWLSIFWIGLFTIIISGGLNWYFGKQLKEATRKFETCESNLEEIFKQYGQPSIKLELGKEK